MNELWFVRQPAGPPWDTSKFPSRGWRVFQSTAHLAGTAEAEAYFESVADWLEDYGNSPAGGLRGRVVVIDLYEDLLESVDKWDPLATNQGEWAAAVANLILAFPEVHWVLKTAHNVPPSLRGPHGLDLDSDSPLSEVMRLRGKGFEPLFDPAGLRKLLRGNLRAMKRDGDGERPKHPGAAHVPLRPRSAAAIDEETAYTYLNAYAAYRHGFRACTVTSLEMMEDLFSLVGAAPEIDVVFEDLYLEFPGTEEQPAVRLRDRDESFPGLSRVPFRIVVTVGHRVGEERRDWADNWTYVKAHRRPGVEWWNVLYKPYAGLQSLWQESGLSRRLGVRGSSQDYEWPLHRQPAREDARHSAPGRLLRIAERLINRAERILVEAQTVREAIHGAVLALDALEFLGARNPTSSLEAVARRHQLEVVAECMFYGVGAHLDIGHRMREIRAEVRAISRQFHRSTRRFSALNSELGILNEIVVKLREYNQFEEEQQCLARARRLNTELWSHRHPWLWIFRWPRLYIGYLMGGIHRFVAAIIVWVLVFGLAYWWAGDEGSGYWQGVLHATVAFFSVGPPFDKMVTGGPAPAIVSLLITVVSFVHLGIFIAHIYSLVARR